MVPQLRDEPTMSSSASVRKSAPLFAAPFVPARRAACRPPFRAPQLLGPTQRLPERDDQTRRALAKTRSGLPNAGTSLALALLLFACGETPRPDPGPVDGGPVDGGSARDAGVDRDAGAGRDGGNPDPNALCPPGATLSYYSLVAPDPLPPASALQLPNLPNGVDVIGADPEGVSSGVRLDVCETSSGPVLAGVLFHVWGPQYYVPDATVSAPTMNQVQHPEGMVYETRFPPDRLSVDGLAAAIAGDPSSLRIRVMLQDGLLFQGHDDFVAVASGNVSSNSIVYNAIYVVVGAIVPGNVFDDLECPFNEYPRTASFALDTASFDVRYCAFQGGGETEGYRIEHLTVTDTNAALAPAEQVPFVFEGAEAVESVLNYQWNHHNACDSFHLALPHADYAASTAPLAGCGTTVPNAPPRRWDDPPGPVLFRLRYHGGAWVDGAMASCSHYLYCDR